MTDRLPASTRKSGLTLSAAPEVLPEAPASAPTRERTSSDVLLAAARYIEEHGWVQNGAWIEKDGRACAVGSIAAVTRHAGSKNLFRDAEDRLCEFLGVVCAESWNDRLGRTRDEVLAALRAAAVR